MPAKWVLITGVSEHGMGDALATELRSKGINVIATGPTTSQLDYLDTSTPLEGNIEKLQLDVTSPSSISAAVEATDRITHGQLHYLVNNAGYGYMMPLLDVDVDKMKKNFEVNVFGVVAVTQAFFPLLRAAEGMVVNQASIAGLFGIQQPFIGSYSASKSALVSISNTMRGEFAPFNVKVVTLITGDVKTSFWQHAEGGGVGIPDSSPYALIKDKVNAMLNGKTNPPGQRSAQEWAKSVAYDILKSRPPVQVYRGFFSTTCWWMSQLMPYWLSDFAFSLSTDLRKLRSQLQKGEQVGKKGL